MSKIYEALLRAEQERTNAAQTADVVPVDTLPRNGSSPSAPAEQPSTYYAPEPAAGASYTVPSPGFEVDLAQVAELPWSPALDVLPALAERGKGVEQFRSLRSRLYEFRSLNTLKSVLISSGLPKEGKSYVTANIAVSLARNKNSRVLLIDGDMRRSSLDAILGTTNQIGLTEYLSGTATLLEVMQRPRPSADGQPLPPGLATLTFIPGGSQSDHAADLSSNGRFARLLETLAPRFDWIIVDSSPVNLVADGVNLARSCDGVLLVARGGVTRFEAAQRALTELKAAKILGFVLNAVDSSTAPDSYYDYESYDAPKA